MKKPHSARQPAAGLRRRLFTLSALALASSAALPVRAQEISEAVKAQISEILTVKSTFSPEEQKMDSGIAFARRKALGLDIGAAADALTPVLGASDFVKVEIVGTVRHRLRSSVNALGGQVTVFDKAGGFLVANVTVDSLATLAASPDVFAIRSPLPRHTNVGLLTSQGTISQQTKTVNRAQGVRGAGVKVGVISDSASQARINALIASGDLGPNSKSLIPYVGTTATGQPTDLSTDEGAAIMEIIQDIVPAATVEFASGFGDFPNAVISLQKDGCQVIIDDLGGPEGVFQDDAVALAVNQVTSEGSIYISSAGNSGSVAHTTSGCWEGDFVNGGTYTPPAGSASTKGYNIHAFAPGQLSDQATVTGEPYQYLTWSDPLNASTNDYDLFVTDSTGATLKGFSVSTQSPASPYFAQELLGTAAVLTGGNYATQSVGDRFVITAVASTTSGTTVTPVATLPRALHFDTERGFLSIGTGGATYGHNAGLNTVSVAASYWGSARIGTKAFNGTNNPCETFSSDGPRKIFYNPDGSSITQGNYLFGTGGGATLAKPDVTGADGVSCVTPGFLPFFGTSAAAPHVAGVAALVVSARLTAGKTALTPAQIHTILTQATLDNETLTNSATTYDPTGGYGVVMAPKAVQAALALP